MYYVNREQIEKRLQAIPELARAVEQLQAGWQGSLLEGLAQERALHLAIETVTDVGSFLIDGFLMRDASSYEDIVEIIGGEGVIPPSLHEPLVELVRLRRPLVQQYYEWPRVELHPLTPRLAQLMRDFAAAVQDYLRSELGGM
ncbi:hypothetical protein IJ21_36280 [Paenibacillus sp. 32O-W]|nr:HepT-like ribonuclease domain-containing protein [Paenibacillus sp. 32O-W]ALS29016.1 hypothetical protein IJ21_36280 [Paenibacillus sp. 32O-W]